MKILLPPCMFLLFLLQGIAVFAQKTDIGVSLGVLGSRFTVKDNSPVGSIIIRQGAVFPGASIGISSVTGASRDQPFYSLKLYSMMLAEVNYVYNGGNVELLKTNVKNKEFIDLKYVLQQANFNVMYLGKLRTFRFMLGPSLVYSFQRNLSYNKGTKTTANNQINQYVLHGEVGVGWKIHRFLLSGRYNFSVTDFSKETSTIQTTYNAYQLRIVGTYFFYQRKFEKNWRSIYWK